MRSGRLFPHPMSERLSLAAGCSLLPTPCASDGRSYYVVSLDHADLRMRGENGNHVHLIHLAASCKRLKKAWANPVFWEAVMGFPPQWTDCEFSETP